MRPLRRVARFRFSPRQMAAHQELVDLGSPEMDATRPILFQVSRLRPTIQPPHERLPSFLTMTPPAINSRWKNTPWSTVREQVVTVTRTDSRWVWYESALGKGLAAVEYFVGFFKPAGNLGRGAKAGTHPAQKLRRNDFSVKPA